MRIWHEELIPKLCRQHLLAVWREALGCYSIIVNNKSGYRNHPAVKEFEDAPVRLWYRLCAIRAEMCRRGYCPKPLPKIHVKHRVETLREWQTLPEQIEVLKSKNCDCDV